MQGLFRPYRPDQQFLLPPSLRDWLPEGHLAYFISDTVDELDLSAIEARYRNAGQGNVAYHPQLMLKLLFYAYATGVFSSREIAAAIEDRIAFRVLAAGEAPSHRTLARFRKDHLAAFEALFVEVVQIAQASGLVQLGTLAVDGSKVRANASKHKAMSYERMQKEERRLRREIQALTARAGDRDAAEDVEFGPDFRGDEVPAELQRREDRLRTIRAAKKRLEARKKQEAAPQIAAEKRKEAERKKTGEPKRGPKRKHPLGKPKPKDQENFTDPDSRIMKTGQGFQQCYNAQIAVDGDAQIIVAADVTQCAADHDALLPMVEAAQANTDTHAGAVLADAGYKSEKNFLALEAQDLQAYIPLGREDGKKPKQIDAELVATKRMQRRMRGPRARQRYRKRKHIAEPPFGWIKSALGFRAFLLRGVEKVRGEWNLVCLALNLKRMNQRLVWR
jgi:transposase